MMIVLYFEREMKTKNRQKLTIVHAVYRTFRGDSSGILGRGFSHINGRMDCRLSCGSQTVEEQIREFLHIYYIALEQNIISHTIWCSDLHIPTKLTRIVLHLFQKKGTKYHRR